MYKRLISVDEETDNILKQQPKRKASDFVRDAVKLKSRTLSTDEPPKPEENEPEAKDETIPVGRVRR